MNTQTQLVHQYMKDHGSVTPYEALMNLGVGRLSARIWDLKKSQVAIRTEIKEVRSRSGTARVACYSLA